MGVPRMLLQISLVFQGRLKGVTQVLQGCYMGVSALFPGGVSRLFQGCFKDITRVLHGCYKVVKRVLKGC